MNISYTTVVNISIQGTRNTRDLHLNMQCARDVPQKVIANAILM